ncbi:sulfatase [Verrucomicrobiota bacterium]
MEKKSKPNIILVFADQMRAQSTGYAGDPNVISPNLDNLSKESINFKTAVSACPICTPYRGCLLTGKYPLSTGVIMNDIALRPDETTIAKVLASHGYNTGYIGKWHLNGPARKKYIPKSGRGGYDFWAAYNSGHNYFDGFYFTDEPDRKKWKGYEPDAQTDMAIDYINSYDKNEPFFLTLSYGTPHNPYDQVPKRYKEKYRADSLVTRKNFMNSHVRDKKNLEQYKKHYSIEKLKKDPSIYRGVFPEIVHEEIIGYNAHITALDENIGRLLSCIEDKGIRDNTIFLFTSDHGDMLGSHRKYHKQWPYDESILVPCLLRYPKKLRDSNEVNLPFNVVDIMPTLLGLADVPVPESVEGYDFTNYLTTGKVTEETPDAALFMIISPFLSSPSWGMREYRGIRTSRYTYTRMIQGPWMLFDNQKDPYQENNLINIPEYESIQKKLDSKLNELLNKTGDDFQEAEVHRERLGIFIVKDDDAIPTLQNNENL